MLIQDLHCPSPVRPIPTTSASAHHIRLPHCGARWCRKQNLSCERSAHFDESRRQCCARIIARQRASAAHVQLPTPAGAVEGTCRVSTRAVRRKEATASRLLRAGYNHACQFPSRHPGGRLSGAERTRCLLAFSPARIIAWEPVRGLHACTSGDPCVVVGGSARDVGKFLV